MPTVNEVLGGLLQRAIDNPKTTAQSFLTCFLFLVPTLLASGIIHGKAAAVAGMLLSIAKIWVGANQHDGTVLPAGTQIDKTSSVSVPK